MRRRNNIIVATIFIALLFLAAIPLDWLTTSSASGAVTVTGLNGHLDFPGLANLPIWLLLCGSAAVTFVAGLNYIRATNVPFASLAAALVAVGTYYVLPVFALDDPMHKISVSAGAGPFVALIATFAATLLALHRPLPSPISEAKRAFPRAIPGYPLRRR